MSATRYKFISVIQGRHVRSANYKIYKTTKSGSDRTGSRTGSHRIKKFRFTEGLKFSIMRSKLRWLDWQLLAERFIQFRCNIPLSYLQ